MEIRRVNKKYKVGDIVKVKYTLIYDTIDHMLNSNPELTREFIYQQQILSSIIKYMRKPGVIGHIEMGSDSLENYWISHGGHFIICKEKYIKPIKLI
jgi:hypothetical protein